MHQSILFILSICIISIHSQRARKIQRCQDKEECLSQTITASKIECSGEDSCNLGTLTSTAKRGYVKCTGSKSCEDATNIDVNKNLFCEGDGACTFASGATARIIQCSAEDACYNAGGISADTDLFCGGQMSCYSSLGVLTSGKTTNCLGYRSCYRSTINADDDVNCEAGYSCQESVISTPTTVVCGSLDSCEDATITAGVSVQAHGAWSAQAAYITDTPLVEAYGAESVKNSIIDSGSLTAMRVNMYAPQALAVTNAGANIRCRAGAICDVYCKDTACLHAIYDCETGATCNVDPVDCATNSGLTVNGVRCPNITLDAYIPPISSKNNKFVNNVQGSEDINNQKKYESVNVRPDGQIKSVQETDDDEDVRLSADVDKLCDLQNECAGESIDNSGLGVVNCGGLSSCSGGDISNDADIYCMGESACSSSSSLSTSGSSGRIQCSGARSCESAASMTSGSASWGGITCSGFESCQDVKDMTSYGTLPCSGDSSCKRSNMTVTGFHVNCFGHKSCEESEIEVFGSGQYVYCWGSHSCSFTKMTKGTVSAIGALCYGSYSCSGATLDTNAATLIGPFSGSFATIYSTKDTLFGSGYRSLAFAQVFVANDGSTESHSLRAYGHQAGKGATYTCQAGSSCKLRCEGTGCLGLDYICEAGATCNTVPRQCKPGMNMYEDIHCPNRVDTSNKAETQIFLRKKRMRMENDAEYKLMVSDMMKHNERYEASLKVDIDEDMDDEFLSFDDGVNVIQKEGSFMEIKDGLTLLLVVIGLVFVVGLVYAWNCRKNKEYQSI